jgi:arylsulfatase
LRRHKTWVHEGGISTPLIAHWPKGIAARGELRHSPAHLIDIVPTVLELTGLEHPQTIAGKPAPPLPGKSLVPEFAMDRSVSRDYLWWLHEGNRAIRIGDWKLVAAGGPQGPWELYDLSQDRGEIKNLAAAHPDKVRELQQAWEQHLAEFREQALRDLPPSAPKGTKKAAGKKAKAKAGN